MSESYSNNVPVRSTEKDPMQTCASCRHWDKPEGRVDFRSTVTYSTDMDHDWEAVEARQEADDLLFGECQAVAEGWDVPMTEPTPVAVVLDGSHYRAGLFTRAEFGCTLWQSQDIPPGPITPTDGA